MRGMSNVVLFPAPGKRRTENPALAMLAVANVLDGLETPYPLWCRYMAAECRRMAREVARS